VVLKRFGVALAVAFFPVIAPPTGAQTAVDVELALLVDSSGSIDDTEFDLQRFGYADALRSPAIKSAILDTTGGRLGRIAATFIYWSGVRQQEIAVDWTLIDSAAASDAFADAILAAGRPFDESTSPGGAIDFAAPLFNSNGFAAPLRIIDISSDGHQNSPDPGDPPDYSHTLDARTAALDAGIDQINALVILGDPDAVPDLTGWYNTYVRGGAGSFVLAVDGFDTFGSTLQAKIVREVPEPESWMLMVAGAALIVLIARRRLDAGLATE
jgi:hypothetical protein